MSVWVRVRAARPEDVDGIARLNNAFAGAGLMLHRSPEVIASAIGDYVVAESAPGGAGQGARGRLLACAALKEYSPSLAEVAAVAVAPDAHGQGLGRRVVHAVEAMARKRGVAEVFALTLQPEFFAAIGYARVERSRYPEKVRRDCMGCARRFACDEACLMRDLTAVDATREAA